METENRGEIRTVAELKEKVRRARQSTPDSKAHGKIRQNHPFRIIGMIRPASTESWTEYVRYTVLLGNLQITPTETVGFLNNPESLTPNTRGLIHQVKKRTNLR